jgi:hypothetical protein
LYTAQPEAYLNHGTKENELWWTVVYTSEPCQMTDGSDANVWGSQTANWCDMHEAHPWTSGSWMFIKTILICILYLHFFYSVHVEFP